MKEVFLFPSPQTPGLPCVHTLSYLIISQDHKGWWGKDQEVGGQGSLQHWAIAQVKSDLQGDPPSALRPSFELLCYSLEPQKEFSSED